MSSAIRHLLTVARIEKALYGAVPADTQMNLAAEGYLLCALEDDLRPNEP